MDMTNNNAISTIAESIVSASKEILSKAEYDVTFISTIIAEQDKHGNYGIMYRGNQVHIPNYTGRELALNTNVFVTIPSNDYQKMYISTVLDDSIFGGGSGESGTSNYNDLQNKPRINGITLTGNKTTADLRIEVPKKMSELANDVGYITADVIPDVPTKVSELTNDAGYITADDLPSPTSAIAENVSYNNSSSGLSATNVQAAIDEIAASGGGGGAPIVIGDDYVSKDEFVEFVNLLVDKLGS